MEQFLYMVVAALLISPTTSTLMIFKGGETTAAATIAFKPIQQFIAHKQHLLNKFKPTTTTNAPTNDMNSSADMSQSSPTAAANLGAPTTTSTPTTATTPVATLSSTTETTTAVAAAADPVLLKNELDSTGNSVSRGDKTDVGNYPNFLVPYMPMLNYYAKDPFNFILIPVPYPFHKNLLQ